jgi:arabinofuranosyltransferase
LGYDAAVSQRGKRAAGARRPAPSRAIRLVQAAGAAGALALGAWILHVNRHYYHDDAYITLRYARNLLDGIGPVWNPGERVQGYTNFLHLVLVSAFGLAGADLVWASRAVGILSLVALVAGLILTSGLLARDERYRAYRHLPAMFAASSAPLIVWSIGGLEGSLFALCTSLGCLLFAGALTRPENGRLFAGSGACLALGVLARPDGIVFVGVTALWLVATWRARPLRSAVAFAAPCFGLIAAQACWQLVFYGDAVPNTFYAKAAGFSPQRWAMGVAYLRTYVLEAPYLVLLAAGAALAATARGWRGDRRVTYLALLVVAYGFFVAFIGGDYMPAFRLILPVIVPLAVIFSLVLPSLLGLPRAPAVAAVTVLALALSAVQTRSPVVNPEDPDPAAVVGTAVGKYIAWAWPPGSLVALNTAGSTPYYAPGQRFIDMLGLNDARIAHRHVTKIELPWQTVPGHMKGDGAYVLSRAPDFIILGPAEGAPADEPRATNTLAPWFLSDLEISRDPRFWERYELEQVRVGRNGETVSERGLVFSYYRKKAP